MHRLLRRPLARAAPLLVTAAALALGCAAAPAAPSAGAPTAAWSATATSPWPAGPPTIVHQGIGHYPTAFQATPRGTWIVDARHGELVVIDPETANVVWRFPMHAIWPQLIMSADGRYVAALARERDGHDTHTLLFAWDLAVGRELFHRRVDMRDNRPGGILISAGTIHVAECEPSTISALKCGFRDFDLATGAPRQPPPTGPRLPGRWPTEDGAQWQPEPFPGSTQYSADGRLVLVPSRFADTIVYSVDPPAVVTSLPGKCAELDSAGDLLWAPRDPAMVSAAQAALAAAGVRLRVIPACPPRPASAFASRGGRFVIDIRTPHPNDKADYTRWITGGRAQWFRITRADTGTHVDLPGFNETSSIGLFPRIGVNHDLLWEREIDERPYQLFLQRADRAELPRALPPLSGKARFGPAGAIVWGPDDMGRLRVMRTDNLVEALPGPLLIPGARKWWMDQFSPLLPDGRFLVATEGSRLAIALGPPTRVTRLPWVHVTDASSNVTFAGRRYLLVGDLNEGLAVVDLETQRRVAVIAKSEGEKSSDALPTSDGASAWVLIGQRDPDADRIDQLSLPDGRKLASRRIPKLEWAGTGTFTTFQTRTGWLDPDRRIWIVGGDYDHGCLEGANDRCVITTIDLTTDPAGVRVVEAPGTGHVTAAPDSSFFAQTTPAQFGFNLFRPDGQTFLTTGAIAGGSYSFTPDGRFACSGDACRMLRCTVNGRSEPIDHPACRPLRRDAFGIDLELAGRGR